MPPPFTLVQSSPAWGLPSFNPFCTTVQAYLKFTKTKFKVENLEYPPCATVTEDELPALKVGDKTVAWGCEKALAHLKENEGIDADAHLSAAQRAEARAFIAMIEHQLYTAMVYSWWVDAENFKVTAALYRRNEKTLVQSVFGGWLPFPVAPKMRARAEACRVEHEDKAVERAAMCFDSLATRLGSAKYFGGSRPSSLDAAAFAHLATVYFAPMPNGRLAAKLRTVEPLRKYVEAIRGEFFNDECAKATANSYEIAPPTKDVPKKDERSPKEIARRKRARDAVIFGVGALVFFLLATDKIKIQQSDG